MGREWAVERGSEGGPTGRNPPSWRVERLPGGGTRITSNGDEGSILFDETPSFPLTGARQ